MIVFTMCHTGCETPPLREFLLELMSTSKCINSVLMKLHEGGGVSQLD